MGLKIAIVVHGRFHAFDLAREFLGRGHDVTLFTNYPRWAVVRFGVPGGRIVSFWPHGVASRIVRRLHEKQWCSYPEPWLHESFGRWAASKISREPWDVVVCWSGVGEETFSRLAGGETLLVCMRGSAHIRAQASLLEEEQKRTGSAQDRPSQWIIAREEREYMQADLISVPSTFARETFLKEGVDSSKVQILPLGVSASAFRPSPDIIEARCTRISSGEPLRVLNVGTLSYQKGLLDTASLIKQLGTERFEFRFVGPIATGASTLVRELHASASFVSKRPQKKLPHYYAWGDVFILPTIQDGHAMVLDQAVAAGLPILATTNCAAPDLIQQGRTGWVLPIRSPEGFVRQLRWCDDHREEVVCMVRRIYKEFRARDWADVAADFESVCLEYLDNRREKVSCNAR